MADAEEFFNHYLEIGDCAGMLDTLNIIFSDRELYVESRNLINSFIYFLAVHGYSFSEIWDFVDYLFSQACEFVTRDYLFENSVYNFISESLRIAHRKRN